MVTHHPGPTHTPTHKKDRLQYTTPQYNIYIMLYNNSCDQLQSPIIAAVLFNVSMGNNRTRLPAIKSTALTNELCLLMHQDSILSLSVSYTHTYFLSCGHFRRGTTPLAEVVSRPSTTHRQVRHSSTRLTGRYRTPANK